MMVESSSNLSFYLLTLSVVIMVSLFANRIRQTFEPSADEENELIRKYLLNDSPLYGYNRPKIWIHSKYEINARQWKDFYSRNTTDLNQPYIHLTIKTIINHCGNDFNICLIDDESFSKLLPAWDIDLVNVAEPMRSHFREIGMLQLLYFYGGMVIPNSFLCLENLSDFYKRSLAHNRPFVCESINHTVNILKQKHKLLFVPNTYIMGAMKNDGTIKELIDFAKQLYRRPHFTSETDFAGDISQFCIDCINKGEMNLVGGEQVGVKTVDRKTILLDNLMEENYLSLHDSAVGIYIPADEILRRTKYQWFAVMPAEQLLQTKLIIAKYLAASIMESSASSTEIKSVTTL